MIRTLLVLLLASLPLAAPARSYRADEVPNVQLADRNRYVSNPDGILTPGAVARIDSVCASLRAQGIAEVAVVAVDAIEGGDPFSFAIELFRSWGVGRARDDNGLGILLVKELREIRFVTGGGLEGVMTDAMSKRIQVRYMVPYFREGDYSAGMVAGVEAVARVLEGGDLAAPPDAERRNGWIVVVIVLGGIVLTLVGGLVANYRSKRCPRCGAHALRLESQERIQSTRDYDLMEYTYRCGNCGYTLRRRGKQFKDNGLGGGMGGGMLLGGGGFGRGGGGFGGGFGGGSFGGGGAGTRW